MSITAFAGPLDAYGVASQSTESNPDRSPSLFDQGFGIMDPRTPYAYQPGGVYGNEGDRGAYGWYGAPGRLIICDQVPSTIATASIAALQVPVAGTALTLASATAAGITVGVSITRADTGATVTGLLAIDGAMTPVQNGSVGGNLFWDPTKAIARALQITSVGNDSGATALVSGYDVYGYPMSESITLSNATVATGLKAFKYIASIVPAGTLSGSNISIGQSDKIGLLLRSDRFQYLQIYFPDTTLISATTGYVAAVTTDPATTTTGDVRGTYALQTASNNTRRLVISIAIPLANSGTSAGLVGVTQA